MGEIDLRGRRRSEIDEIRIEQLPATELSTA
jgi:hypothetical protein